MEIKSIIKPIIFWVLLIALLVAVGYWIISPIFGGNHFEFYLRLFIFLFMLQTFAILRLYNSIVQNTRFSIELRKTMVKFMQTIPLLDRSMKNLNSAAGNIKSSMESLKKTVSENSDVVAGLSDTIKKHHA